VIGNRAIVHTNSQNSRHLEKQTSSITLVGMRFDGDCFALYIERVRSVRVRVTARAVVTAVWGSTVRLEGPALHFITHTTD
jgi:hypothetical protein